MRRMTRLILAVGVGSGLFALSARAQAPGTSPGTAPAPSPAKAPTDGGAAGGADASASAAGFADAGAAMDYLDSVNWNGGSANQAKLDAAAEALKPAAEREPTNARWQTGMAIVSVTKRDFKAAKTYAEKAVELDAKNAAAQYWLGNALFNDINNVGMFDKMSYASKGRKAYEKAIEADPKHVGARMGLIQFYLNAPGVAGGSVKKAKELAKEVAAIPGSEVVGHTQLAAALSKDGEHDAASSEFDAAFGFATTDAEKRTVLSAKATALLRDKKDYAAAIATAEQILPIAGDREPSVRYMIGDAKRQQKDYPGAVEQFTLVLTQNPEAMNTRFGLAQCFEAQEKWADAAREYDEFARRFPKDDRAEGAQKSATKMRKKAESAAKAKG